MSAHGHAPPPLPRWLVFLRLGRVSNLPTVWTDALAGMFLVGVTPQPGPAAWLMLALSLFYTGGMYLNDAFDHAYDQQHHPTRPIPSGLVTRDEVFALGFVQLMLGESVLAVPFWIAGVRPSWMAMTGGVVLGLLIVYYNYHHKKNPLSPLVMALCRALVYGVAAIAAADLIGHVQWSPALGWGMAVLACYLVGLTYVAKQEDLNRMQSWWPVALLAIPFLYAARILTWEPWMIALVAFFLVWVAYGVWQVLRRPRNIPRAVMFLIAGICLLDGLLMAGAGAGPAWVFLTLAAFALTLLFQRSIPGT